jgi:catechol 2,3-dioxygenase-like lactoylglutathione lyase family enzyme
MKTRLLALTMIAAVCGFAAGPASAQLAAPNAAGVSIGHVHINASDVDAQVRFWTAVRKQDYSGGTVGSTVNHFGFYVRDFDASVAKWKAAGLTWERADPTRGQGFLTGPDSVRIEIYENKSIATPMQMHHIHLMVSDPLQAQQWYVKNFGAAAGKRAQYDVANVPGTEITLAKTDTPQSPTKGRSLDHIGFEVKNIDAFVAKLQAAGIKTDAAIRNSANAAGLRIVYVTDPWGTEIEITEGLSTTPTVAP